MNNLFKQTVKIRYSEADCTLTLKPSVLLNFLQDLASENAEGLGFGYSAIIKKNLAWFLLKYHIEFDDYPENLYDLTIYTEPRGYNKLFAYRDFTVKNEDRIIARAASTWGLIDIESKSMVQPSLILENNSYMKPFEKRENDLKYERIKNIERVDLEKRIEVSFDSLDVNQHVNNANYISWALEPLDFDFRIHNKLKTLDIAFKKETQYGEKIVSQVEKEDNLTCHSLKNLKNNEELCSIRAIWTQKA